MALLPNRIALVTGAGRGIGSSVARLFAGEGATVAVHYNHSAEAANKLASEIGGLALRADLTNPSEASKLADDIITQLGKVDILVNCAASFTHGTEFADDDWSSYLHELNGVFGTTFHITRALAPHMKTARYGRIINFGATLLHRPVAGYGPHISAKSAVVGLTSVLVRELGPFGITVNLIHPGMTLTDFSNSLPESERARVAARTPLRRLATAEDVAKIALFYASDLADFVSGAGIAPDGGLAAL